MTNDNNWDVLKMILFQDWFYPIESAELVYPALSLYHSKSIWRDLYQIHLINYYTCQRNMTCFASQSLVQHCRSTPIAIVSGGDSRLMWEKMRIRSQNNLTVEFVKPLGKKNEIRASCERGEFNLVSCWVSLCCLVRVPYLRETPLFDWLLVDPCII